MQEGHGYAGIILIHTLTPIPIPVNVPDLIPSPCPYCDRTRTCIHICTHTRPYPFLFSCPLLPSPNPPLTLYPYPGSMPTRF